MPFFKKSDFRTDCDRCGIRFEPASGGGVCASCKAILCNQHLHGDLLQRARTWMGAPTVCVRCRAEGLGPGRQGLGPGAKGLG
jgi:hypothetical protein